MKAPVIGLLVGLFGLSASAAPAPVPSTATLEGAAATLRDKALADPTAWNILESLTTEVGPRMAGSSAAERARDWGLAKLRELGFQNVHAEPFPITAWERGAESAQVIAPYPQKLVILGLGRSVPTPPGGIEAEAVLFPSYAALLAAPVGSLTGKIAVVTQRMVRTQDVSGYSAINAARTRGPSEAARRGAVAYLVRSLSTDDTRLPHTGAMTYAADAPRIPAAALSTPDGDLLENMARRGRPVRIKLNLESMTRENAPAWNVVGEIPGRNPNEIIVIGGHLDSWDPGTGAVDDGAGIAITTAAAKLLAGQNLNRTLRVVMFGAEETAYSGAAYAAAHRDEMARMALTSESDTGADRIWALQLPARAASPGTQPTVLASMLPRLLAPLTINVTATPATDAGDDVAGLLAGGVPAFSLRQDMSRYFDLHHSADDTLDKVDRAQLNQNVAAWVTLLFLAASGDEDYRTAR